MTDRRALRGTVARPWRARAATLLIFLANGTGIGAWAASIPRVKSDLGLSDGALGIALLAVAAGAIVAMPLTGRLGARRRSHISAGLSGLVFGPALLLPAFAPGLPWLIGAGVLLGAANGTMDVAMNAHASVVERSWQRAIMSSFHAAFSLGGFAGSFAITGLAAAGVARGPALAALAAAVVLLVGIALRVGVALPADRPLPDLPQGAAPAKITFRPSRRLVGISALTFIVMLVEGAVADWSGVFLTTVAGASLAAGSAVYGGFAAAMFVGRLLGDATVHRLGAPRTLRLGAALTAFGLVLALATATPGGGAVGFAVVGLGIANLIPILFSASARSQPGAPGIGVSTAATVGYTGFLVGPPVIGAVADALGLRLAMVALPVAILAIAAMADWAREGKPG